MDFESISSKALDKVISETVNRIINKDKNETFKFDDSEFENDVQTFKLMQEFSTLVAVETVKIYHEELSKKLKEQGIQI